MMAIEIKNGLVYNSETLEFTRGGDVILVLSHTHGIFLNAIINNGAKQPTSRKEIVDILWGGGSFNYSAAINQKMFSLRKKLKTISLSELIITVHGIGYRINPVLIIEQPVIKTN